MRHLLFSLILWVLGLTNLHSQSIQQVRAKARNDLKDSIERLALFRKQIEEEKTPLTLEVAKLERDARDKRAQIDQRMRQRDNRDASLLQLKDEVKRENEAALETSLRLLKDYARGWVQSVPSSERILHSSSLIRLGIRTFVAYLDVAALSTSSIINQAGGGAYSGDAIVPPEGIRESGIFWTVGPLLYFRGDSGSSGFLDKSYEQTQDTGADMTADSVKRNTPPRLLIANESTSQKIGQALLAVSQKMTSCPWILALGKH